MRSKANMSQLNLPHGNWQLKSVKNRKKTKSGKTDMLRNNSKQSRESMLWYLSRRKEWLQWERFKRKKVLSLGWKEWVVDGIPSKYDWLADEDRIRFYSKMLCTNAIIQYLWHVTNTDQCRPNAIPAVWILIRVIMWLLSSFYLHRKSNSLTNFRHAGIEPKTESMTCSQSMH